MKSNPKISMRQWDSKNAMLENARGQHPEPYFLGGKIDAPKEFFSLEANDGHGVIFNIASLGSGLKPDWLLTENSEQLFLGCNDELTISRLKPNFKVEKVQRLNSYFQAFLFSVENQTVLAICETSVAAYDIGGRGKWTKETDLILSYYADDCVLHIEQSDADELDLHIATGQPIRK